LQIKQGYLPCPPYALTWGASSTGKKSNSSAPVTGHDMI
jgi:hypothetical protein